MVGLERSRRKYAKFKEEMLPLPFHAIHLGLWQVKLLSKLPHLSSSLTCVRVFWLHVSYQVLHGQKQTQVATDEK